MGRTLFGVAGIALIGWALMIFVPRWRFTRFIARHELFPFFLALLYVIAILDIVFTGPPVFWNFGDADNILALLTREDVALLTWIHVLAFSHLAGVVIFRDNTEHAYVPTWIQSLLLLFTLFFGPLGYAAYRLVRLARRGRRSHAKSAESGAAAPT
jgi:hypothetical protein